MCREGDMKDPARSNSEVAAPTLKLALCRARYAARVNFCLPINLKVNIGLALKDLDQDIVETDGLE
jgi:hypothetical protein